MKGSSNLLDIESTYTRITFYIALVTLSGFCSIIFVVKILSIDADAHVNLLWKISPFY